MTTHKDNLLAAIEEMVNEAYPGSLISSYTVIAQYIDGDGDQAFALSVHEGQSQLTTASHAILLDEYARRDLRRVLS